MSFELFLTFEDRMALLDRAMQETGGIGVVDYFGQLVEVALMYPDKLDQIKEERMTEAEIKKPLKEENLKKSHLRIVK